MRRVDPARVHSVTLAIWLSGMLVVAVVVSFPRFFGALLLMALAVAAYGAVFVYVESRMREEYGDDQEDIAENPAPAPVRRKRTRRAKRAATSPVSSAREASPVGLGSPVESEPSPGAEPPSATAK